jgi:DNA-binding NarL/FixJ family response regulator
MSRILIVDDHPSVREGLQSVLAREFQSVETDMAGTAAEALRRAREFDPDVVILDMTVPGLSGPELVADLKRANSRSRILVYTVHEEQQLGARTIRAGADGYLTKDKPMTQVMAAVRDLLAGKRHITTALADALAEAISGPVELHTLLSDREMQVMRQLVRGEQQSEIAASLNLSVKTVGTYRTRILEKLRLTTTAELIRYGLTHKLD